MEHTKPPTLDQVITALQKSFSRVSRATGNPDVQEAKAYVVDTVQFGLDLRADYGDDHHLFITPNGSMGLKLEGTIQTDVRVEPGEAEEK